MKPNKRSSRLLALALLLVLSLSLSLPALAAGEDDIIYIHTAKDLCAFSDSCAYDAWSRGKTVLLTADISLRGVDFEPIASFSGTFNGGGHTISGLTLTESLSPAGLFLTLERGAFVHALKVEGQVAPGGTKEFVGGIAGRSYGTIEECSFFGVVKGESAVGGIVGRNEASGLVANCTVSGSVSANRYTGGIAGYNLGTLRACINSASVNAANVDPTLSARRSEHRPSLLPHRPCFRKAQWKAGTPPRIPAALPTSPPAACSPASTAARSATSTSATTLAAARGRNDAAPAFGFLLKLRYDLRPQGCWRHRRSDGALSPSLAA